MPKSTSLNPLHHFLARAFVGLICLTAQPSIAAESPRCHALFAQETGLEIQAGLNLFQEKARFLLSGMYPSIGRDPMVEAALNELVTEVDRGLRSAESILIAKAKETGQPVIDIITKSDSIVISIPAFKIRFPFDFIEEISEGMKQDLYGNSYSPTRKQKYLTAAKLAHAIREQKYRGIRKSIIEALHVERGYGIVPLEAPPSPDTAEIVPIAQTPFGFAIRHPQKTTRFFRGVDYSSIDKALETATKGSARNLEKIPEFLSMSPEQRSTFLNVEIGQRPFGNTKSIFVGVTSRLSVASDFASERAVFIYDLPDELIRRIPQRAMNAWDYEMESVIPFFLSPKWTVALFWKGELVYHRDFVISQETRRSPKYILPGQKTLAVDIRNGQMVTGVRVPELDLSNAYAIRKADGSIERVYVLQGEQNVVQFYVAP
jgi:hypothetical protein